MNDLIKGNQEMIIFDTKFEDSSEYEYNKYDSYSEYQLNELIEKEILEIKGILSKYSTFSILERMGCDYNLYNEDGVIKEKINKRYKYFNKSVMLEQSDIPEKDFIYLYGLVMSIKGNENNIIDIDTYLKIKIKIHNIVEMSCSLTFKKNLDILNYKYSNEEKKLAKIIFKDYYSSPELMYPEQIINRLESWCKSYSEKIKEKTGVYLEDLINFYKYTCKEQEEKVRLYNKYKETNRSIMIFIVLKTLPFEEILEIAKIEGFKNNSFEKILHFYSTERKDRDFKYFTSPKKRLGEYSNPVYTSPICKISDFFEENEDAYIIPSTDLLLYVIYNTCISILEDKDRNKEIKFLKHRGKKEEDNTENIFRKVFNKDCTFYSSVCENINLQNEHDLIIIYKEYLIIIEVKSGKLRDVSRYLDNILVDTENSFKDNIQKAFEQGNNLKKLILSKDSVELFSKENREKITLSKKDFKEIFIISTTSEKFNMISASLSLYLEKQEDENYPWICSLYELENILDCFNYMNKNADDFINFLQLRTKYQNRFILHNELEIAGYVLINNSFSYDFLLLLDEKYKWYDAYFSFDKCNLRIFDKMHCDKIDKYFYYDYRVSAAHVTYVLKNKTNYKHSFEKSVGRNEKCPCGSGLKFKKCHGKL